MAKYLEILEAVGELSEIQAATSENIFLLAKENNASLQFSDVDCALKDAIQESLIVKEKNVYKLREQFEARQPESLFNISEDMILDLAAQGKNVELDLAVQGENSELNLAVQGKNSELDLAVQGKNSEHDLAVQGKNVDLALNVDSEASNKLEIQN